jgi:predicted nucleic acid-binding protein
MIRVVADTNVFLSALLFGGLPSSSEQVRPSISLSVIQDDPDDDRVLECARTGRADYIVSGDRHLLRLGTYDGTSILTVRQFLDQFNAAV